jgi:hypothetical protein
MNHTTYSFLFSGGLFLGMMLLLEVGRRAGLRRKTDDPDGARHGLGVVEGAVFSLLGLLIAFTFSGALARFDGRRLLVTEERNAIAKAYLRLDLLLPADQPALRALFSRYLDSRLTMYRQFPDIIAARSEYTRTIELQNEIWSKAIVASQATGSAPVEILLLPALNTMFDITTTRMEVMKVHPPLIIFAMLGGLALAAALLAGYGMVGQTRSWFHGIGLAAALSITAYVIVDLEYPRLGLIRVDSADLVLEDLSESFK